MRTWRVGSKESHRQAVLSARRDGLGEVDERGRAHAARGELERLERVLHVRVTVREARRVREDLGLDRGRLAPAHGLGRWRRVEVDWRELCVLEGEAADEGGDGVDESKGRDHVRLAVVQQELGDAKDEEDSSRDGDEVTDREAHLKWHLRN